MVVVLILNQAQIYAFFVKSNKAATSFVSLFSRRYFAVAILNGNAYLCGKFS
jgi:hypothetical protein